MEKPHISRVVLFLQTVLCVVFDSHFGVNTGGVVVGQLVPHKTSNDIFMDPCKAGE